MTLVQHILEALSVGGLYALFAMSVALVFGVANIINFAQGEIIAVSAYALLAVADAPLPVVLLTPVVTGVVVALVMERVAFRPLRGADAMTLLVAGFALSVFVQSVLLITVGGQIKSSNFAAGLSKQVDLGGARISYLSLITIGVTIATVVGLTLLLRRTPIGIQLRAAAADLQMAKLLGVRTDVVVGTAFALSGLLAAITAILLVVQSGSLTPDMGAKPLVIAFVATVIGGLGSLYGAALGGLFIGALTVLLQNTLPDGISPFRDAVVYLLIIATLLLRPQGLITSSAAKERV